MALGLKSAPATLGTVATSVSVTVSPILSCSKGPDGAAGRGKGTGVALTTQVSPVIRLLGAEANTTRRIGSGVICCHVIGKISGLDYSCLRQRERLPHVGKGACCTGIADRARYRKMIRHKAAEGTGCSRAELTGIFAIAIQHIAETRYAFALDRIHRRKGVVIDRVLSQIEITHLVVFESTGCRYTSTCRRESYRFDRAQICQAGRDQAGIE